MCRYCVEYGNGTKWYLNPDNYREELYEAPSHNDDIEDIKHFGLLAEKVLYDNIWIITGETI